MRTESLFSIGCQISVLHDTNGDEEVDHYEKYANDFGGFDRSHTHTFGLAPDKG